MKSIMQMRHERIDTAEVLNLLYQTEKILFNETKISRITVKRPADYVTAVDFEVQRQLQGELNRRYPEIAFIGEEGEPFYADTKGSCWILDPVDGTTNLIHHYGMSAVSLGLYEKGRMTFGAVYNPWHKEMFAASENQGAWLNGQRIQVSETDELSFALVSYGSSPYEKTNTQKLFSMYEKIFCACSDFRRSGSAALELCYVACGRTEAFFERNLKPWDYAAGALILQEAGGILSGWRKEEYPAFIEASDICATNKNLSEKIREFISS